jgi:tetratricopeptide (TPR) repeat protein
MRGKGVLRVVIVALVACASLPAAAQDGQQGSGRKPSAEAPKTSAAYREACTQGNGKYVARDFAGAAEAYRRAIDLDPKNSLAFYLLGEAQLAAGRPSEADAAWNQAALVSSERDPPQRAKILFVLADLRERQKKWEDARAAWQVYLDWVARFGAGTGFPESGQARQRVIDTAATQDKAYEIVRRRIEESKNGGLFTDPSKPAPPSSAPASGPGGTKDSPSK